MLTNEKKQGTPKRLLVARCSLLIERQRRAAYRRRPACPECRQDACATSRAALPNSSNSYLLPPQYSAKSVKEVYPARAGMDSPVVRRPLFVDRCSLFVERQRRAAFSLAEILIAIFVLSIGLIMIAAVFPVAAKWTAQDAQTSVAQVIAKNAVAQIQAQYSANPANIPAAVLGGTNGYGPFDYSFGTAQPYPFGTAQSYSTSANFAPSALNPAPASPTPAPVPPPGSYYWSAVMLPAASTYAGSSGVYPGAQNNGVYTLYVFVFNKGDQTNTFGTAASGTASPVAMAPDPQDVPSHLSFYPQLYADTFAHILANSGPTMPIGSLGLDTNTGCVFRLIADPATNAIVPTGLASGSVINNTDTIVYAPSAIGQTASPLIYVYVTTVNL